MATSYEFRYYVTTHALERYRERVEPEARVLSNMELSRLLDERTFAAIKAGNARTVIDSSRPDCDTTVVLVDSRNGQRYWVILRPQSKDGETRRDAPAGRSGLTIVTIVDEDSGNRNLNSGYWKVPTRPMEAALRAVVLPAAKAPDAAATPTPPPAHAPQMPEVTTRPAKVDTRSPENMTRLREMQAAIPKGSKTFEQRRKRMEFAAGVVRQRPHIPIYGSDGLRAILQDRFGLALEYGTLAQIKRDVCAELGLAPQIEVAPTPTGTPAPPTAPPSPANGRPALPPAAATIALDLARAMDDERRAKETLSAASRAFAEAQAAASDASARVEDLMRQLQGVRS